MNTGEGLRRSGSAAWMGLGLLLAATARAEPPETMLSAEEAARAIPAGPWQGNWTLSRDDPRLRTLGAQRALTLAVFHDAGIATADVDWLADRALCEPPDSEPCEWVGASGAATAVAITAQGLYAVLRVSSDETDPFFLHLAPPAGGSEPTALLLSARGDLRLVLTARREAPSTP